MHEQDTTKQVRIFGELVRNNNTQPVVSSDGVYHYSTDPVTSNVVTRTQAAINTDLYTISEGKADKSELTEAIDAINESIATLPGSFDVYSANTGDTIPEGATLTWDGAPVETRIAEVNETKTLMVACARVKENNADWPNPKQVRLLTFVLGHSLVATSAANGAKPFDGFQDEDIAVAEVGYNGTPQEIYFNTVKGCFIGKTGNAIQGYTYYNSWSNDADYRNNAASNVFVYTSGQVARYYRYVENGGYVMGNIINFSQLSTDLKEVWGGAQVDKAYNPLTYSGLGKKTLLKNIVSNVNTLTQAMMPVATVEGQEDPGRNTIYVIQYDYDLGGQTIKIPSGSILLFEGGSLSNGTIDIGNNVNILSADVKIFSNITFTGKLDNVIFHIDWFVGNFCDSVLDNNAPDATAEVQAMFNSGIKRLWLTNRHCYRLTDTVVVDAAIVIDGATQRLGVASTAKAFFASMDKPIFTIKSYISDYRASSCILKNFFVYRYQTDTASSANYFNRAIPTIYIDLTEGCLHGIDWEVYIMSNAPKRECTATDGTINRKNLGGGLGIEMYAANGNYSGRAKFRGFVEYHYEAFYAHTDTGNGSWITNIDFGIDTAAVYGGRICCTSVLSGSHQTLHVLPENTDSYFTIEGDADCSGLRVWDLGMYQTPVESVTHGTMYGVKAKAFRSEPAIGNVTAVNRYSVRRSRINNGNVWEGSDILGCTYLNLGKSFYTDNAGTAIIKNISYTYKDRESDNVFAFSTDNVNNIERLFWPVGVGVADWTDLSYEKNTATLKEGDFKEISLRFTSNHAGQLMMFFASRSVEHIYIANVAESVDIDNTFDEVKEDIYPYVSASVIDRQPIYYPVNSGKIKVVVVMKNSETITANKSLPVLCFSVGNGIGTGVTGLYGGNIYGPLLTRTLIAKASADKTGLYPITKMLSHKDILDFKGTGGLAKQNILHIKLAGYFEQLYVDVIDQGRFSHICISVVSGGYAGTPTNIMLGNIPIQVYRKHGSYEYIFIVKKDARLFCGYVDKIVAGKNFTIIPDTNTTISMYDAETNPEGYEELTFNCPVPSYYDGTNVRELVPVTPPLSGSSNARNARILKSTDVGLQFFDTTLKKPVYAAEISADGLATWVDAAGAAESYMVTYNLTGVHLIEDKKSAAASTNYSTAIEEDEGYALPSAVTVKVNGVSLIPVTDYTYDSETGEIVIGSTSVNGPIVIEATGADPNAQGGGGQVIEPSHESQAPSWVFGGTLPATLSGNESEE